MADRSLHIGTYAGIPVKIHWTFAFTIMLVLYVGIKNDLTVGDTIVVGGLVATLFFCVVLHEYGHALTARRYGIVTRDIILSPIGGIARLEHLPDRPLHEILIAIAGPLVNVAVALVLALVIMYGLGEPLIANTYDDDFLSPVGFLRAILGINVILFFFNLIPAFPMDGGRVLRALLSIRWGRATGTRYAAIVGKILAVGFMAYAIYHNELTLGLISVFIYSMATMENRQVQLRYLLEERTAKDALRPSVLKIYLSDTMQYVIDSYQEGLSSSFLVYDDEEHLAGCLPATVIEEAIRTEDYDSGVTTYMSQLIGYVHEDTSLQKVYQVLSTQEFAVLIVRNSLSQAISGIIDGPSMEAFMKRI